MLTTKQAAILLVSAAIALAIFILGVATAHADDLGAVAEAMFGRIDSNGDGVLTKPEIEAARARMFDRIDADGDGLATAAEIASAKEVAQKRRAGRLSRLAGLRAKAPSPQERFATLDRNKDGKVSRVEFVSASPLFDRLAKNGGKVTKAEFAAFLDAR